jgi:hypothetical protein
MREFSAIPQGLLINRPAGRTTTSWAEAPRRNARERQAVNFLGRKILQAVDGQIGPTLEHRALHLARENSHPAELLKRLRSDAVARRRHGNQLDRATGCEGSEKLRHMMCLPERQAAGARRNPKRWPAHEIAFFRSTNFAP